MKCHPCVNTRQNNPFSAGSGCTNFRNSTLVRHQKTSAHTDTTSISCKRSVCDPLKLKMTPKVNYLGVTMTPENFFEGKTLNDASFRTFALSDIILFGLRMYRYFQQILILFHQPSVEAIFVLKKVRNISRFD